MNFMKKTSFALYQPYLKDRATDPKIRDYKKRLTAGKLAGVNMKDIMRPTIEPSGLQKTRLATLKAKRALRGVGSKDVERAPCHACIVEGKRVVTRLRCQMEGCTAYACDEHYFKMCKKCFDEFQE